MRDRESDADKRESEKIGKRLADWGKEIVGLERE